MSNKPGTLVQRGKTYIVRITCDCDSDTCHQHMLATHTQDTDMYLLSVYYKDECKSFVQIPTWLWGAIVANSKWSE